MSNTALLFEKPWLDHPAPDEIYGPRGMIGVEERRMLYWLAAKYYRGDGTIVDAGSYLGASSLSLASGLAASDRTAGAHARVHAYDLFTGQDFYVRDDISSTFSLSLDENYDFYHLFEAHTAAYRELIVGHRGDFTTSPVPDGPIELLFIDVSKTPALNRRLVEDYFPRLIPGHSVIIQQDYYQAWYPHIPITMEYLCDYVTVADPFIPVSSRLYLLTKPIPERAIHLLGAGLSVDSQAMLLRRAIEKDAGLPRMMLRVIEVLHLVDTQGKHEQARAAARALRRDPEFDPNSHYAVELTAIEGFRQLT